MVQSGCKLAKSGAITTFGIHPDRPETAYGYIERGAPRGEGGFNIAHFVEKPPIEVAERYLMEGSFYWNAGIFLFSPRSLLAELECHAPEIYRASLEACDSAERSGVRHYLNPEAFSRGPALPIDIAVMEKTTHAALIAPVDIGWSDVGSWSAVKTVLSKGSNHNHVEGEAIVQSGQGNYIKVAEGGPLVAAIGLEDMVVVSTKDAVLIMPADRAQEVKAVVQALETTGKRDLL